MSFSTYTARRKLNRLRRSACQLFTSEAMAKAIQRLELEVEARRLLVRKDRHLWRDIGERKKVLNWLLSYNPLWLRIGLETIFGEFISLESNSDTLGLAMFILQRLLWNPDIAAEYRHHRVPNLYKEGHEEALSRFTLKKLLLLVCFLDKAKECRLIEHNPCLFCVDAEFKATKDLLLAFSRDFLSGEGILPRHLGYLGLPVSHVQTPLDEFDFAVKNLAVDLKCGIRLVRVMELLTLDWRLSAKLRLPAISRLQKIHNVDLALQVLKAKGIDLKDEHGSIIDSRDIVDGHREKTLSLLWKIIFAFHVCIFLCNQLRQEIGFLRRTLRTKRRLARVRADQGIQPSPMKTRVSYEHTSTKITLLMEWVRAVCNFYNLKVENFTVMFSDGRVLCYLIHHYHPSILPEASISHSTTQTVEGSPTGLNPHNIPFLQCWDVFFIFMPNVKMFCSQVVMTYLSFLCARLLDLHNETRAARVIQGAWRKYRLKKDLQLYEERNKAALKIQLVVRCFLQKRRAARRAQAAVLIQSAWRGFLARKILRMQKEALLRAVQHEAAMRLSASIIQRRYRALLLGRRDRRNFLNMKCSAVVLQAAFRGHRVRTDVANMHSAALVIQANFRRFRQQKTFRRKRWSAVVLQQRFRAQKQKQHALQQYHKVRKAAVLLQAAYRGMKSRRILQQEHQAAAVIQRSFRAHCEHRSYLTLKASATILLQAVYRGQQVRKEVGQAARAEKRRRFTAVVFHHLCAMKIQRALRAHWALESAKKQINSVVTIQRWLRARQQRRRYLEERGKVVTAQRAVRRWLAHRHKAASVIQLAVRKFLDVKRQQRVQRGIVKAQALWRAHCSRQRHDNAKLVKLRHRLRQISAEVREEDKLCNKTSSALDYLLRYKHFSYILEALQNLETATRLSPECCERLVQSGATNVIFTLIRCCNRSVPCMDVITFSIQILLNLSKYQKTIEAVYSVENSVETLLDLLQRYREKAGDKVAEKGGGIFTKACFLLALLLQDKRRAEVQKNQTPSLLSLENHHQTENERLNKRELLCSIQFRRIGLCTNRSIVCVFRFAPEWVLRKDKLKDIVDPLRAIHMVAETLSIPYLVL
uniref:Calponin-homology (CH) domain-containing protein n=1 Tax=Oryzias latipes TaxID=8090 RepID=A0A3P9IT53_ORYLA